MSKPKAETREPDQAPTGREQVDSTEHVAQLAQERDALQDQLLRAMADMQNFRRRVQQEKEETRKYATESLVAELLPVLDNFERTLVAVESGASMETLVEGVKMVDKQLRSILERANLQKIASQGEQFDPEHHEAVALEETNEHPEGTVIEELQSGYKIAEKVIRPARVRIAKKP